MYESCSQENEEMRLFDSPKKMKKKVVKCTICFLRRFLMARGKNQKILNPLFDFVTHLLRTKIHRVLTLTSPRRRFPYAPPPPSPPKLIVGFSRTFQTMQQRGSTLNSIFFPSSRSVRNASTIICPFLPFLLWAKLRVCASAQIQLPEFLLSSSSSYPSITHVFRQYRFFPPLRGQMQARVE